MIENQSLAILQYNVNNSRSKVMIPMFETDGILNYDILAIQEPWKNPYSNTTNSRLNQYFDTYYMDSPKTRVCFFVNKRIALASYTVTYHSGDINTINLRLPEGRTIDIHNLYNPCKGSGEKSVIPILRNLLEENKDGEHVIVGDFNSHHPKWGGNHVIADADAYELIVMTEKYRLKRTLPVGTITWRRGISESTIDLAFVTPLLRESLVDAEIAANMDNHSDHYPIRTSFELRTVAAKEQLRRNWEKTDSALLQQTLKEAISYEKDLTPTGQHDNSKDGIDRQVKALIEALQKSIEVSTPWTRICPYSKPGFTEECKKASREAKRAKRIWQNTMQEDDWDDYKVLRNKLGRTVKKAMKEQFRKESADGCESPNKMWSKCKWAQKRTSQEACIPALYDHPPILHAETDPAKKADILLKSFFPAPPTVDLTDIDSCEYTQDLITGEITLNEILKAIAGTTAKKAPGGDEITNGILKKTATIIGPHLHRIFNACLEEGYCPEHFRDSVTIALRKGGKSHYSTAASYRPIALLNTVGKIMEIIVAKRLGYLAETYNLLPVTHMGARKAVSTEHALHYLIERAQSAWNEGMVASVMLLDIIGAYNFMAHPRLLHNLRIKRIDERLVRWTGCFLSGRTTILKTNEHITGKVNITVGTPQGSPMSAILFLFYNAPVLDELMRQGTTACGFVDDIALLVKAKTPEENCVALANAHDNVCMPWARLHGVKFSPPKYQLCHITRKKVNIEAPVIVAGIDKPIKAKKEIKYLGVMLDTKMNWKPQINANKTKALKTVGALARLAGSTWGARFSRMRQMLHAVFIPQLTHGCSVWYKQKIGRKTGKPMVTKELAKVQHKAERAITGAYQATSQVALHIETHSLPIDIRLERLTLEAALRIATSPSYNSIIEARSMRKKRGLSPLELLTNKLVDRTKTPIKELEQITSYAAPPWWIPPTISIASDKDAAEKAHKALTENNTKDLFIYTDGSGINGKVGAAAVSPNYTVRRYLGPLTSFTVYSGELYGIMLAIGMAIYRIQPIEGRLIVCIDNQASIQAVQSPGASSGQYLVKLIVRQINHLRSRGIEVELHWIPAHRGIPGNDLVDIAAKQATGWRQKKRRGKLIEYDTNKPSTKAPIIKTLRNALKTVITKDTHKHWIESWDTAEHGRELYSIEPKPRKAILKLHEGLDKELSAILVQMRTGKIGLRNFLTNRRVPGHNDPRCQCGRGLQTVEHILLTCREYSSQRKGLWDREKRRARLGVLRMKEILTDPISAKKAAIFMKGTGLVGRRTPIEEEY